MQKEMCKIINPYRCPNCGNDVLFFTKNHSGTVIDYKFLIDSGYGLNDLINYLGDKNIRYIKCLACQKMYIIDWSNGYPVPLLDRNALKQFGYKFKE